jgi:hypothetical protein
MAVPRRSSARFPAVARSAGHYESFYLKASHPSERLGVWIRYTVHKRPGEGPKGSLWCTLFDRSREDSPWAVKHTTTDVGALESEYIHVGDSVFAPGAVTGQAEGEGRSASWQLSFDAEEEALRHLPRPWMYRAPIPRTKLLSPHPGARFSGRVEVDGQAVELDGWRGMVGHNWGAEHAERWIWMHGAGFAQDEEAWLDAGLGRIRIGRYLTPWIANGMLSIGGQRLRLGGPARIRSTDVSEAPTRCDFTLPGSDLTVQGTLEAPRDDFVGWVYADPDGSEHNTVNCSVADMRLAVSRPGRGSIQLDCEGGAAYELGMRETDHGIAIQPFADG